MAWRVIPLLLVLGVGLMFPLQSVQDLEPLPAAAQRGQTARRDTAEKRQDNRGPVERPRGLTEGASYIGPYPAFCLNPAGVQACPSLIPMQATGNIAKRPQASEGSQNSQRQQ